jgi:CRP-like cAMP-binding protein
MADASDALKRVPLFSGLGRKDLGRLSKLMSERTFGAGEKVMEEGHSGIGFFVIEAGTATVSRGGEALRTLGEGEFFGEVALLDDGPRSASITADGELRCRGMAAWEFRGFMQKHPEVAWPMLQKLAGRLREAEARFD